MKYSLPTHPETPQQLLRRSFLLYSYSWMQVFNLTFLLSITVFLPNLISLLVGPDVFLNLSFFSIQKGWLFLLNLASLIFFVALLWRLHCIIIHKNDSLKEDLKIGLIKAPSILVAAFIQAILISIVVFAFTFFIYYVVLGKNLNLWDATWRNYFAFFFFFCGLSIILFLGLSFYFFLALIVLESKSILNSLITSFTLVWRHWTQTIYVQLTPWIFYFGFLMLLKFIVNLNVNILFFVHNDQNVLMVLIQILIFATFVPWVATTLIVQLKDLELRKLPRFKDDEVTSETLVSKDPTP